MPSKTAKPHRVIRAIAQRLESLQRAGITHLPKLEMTCNAISQLPAAPQVACNEPAKKPAQPTPRASKTPLVAASAPQPAKTVEAATKSEQPQGDPRRQALAALAQKVAKCTRCKELAETRTQTVFGVGNPYSELVFCGEAPGADEDRQGEPFVGRAGQLLNDIIVKGMKMQREDFYILNILRCRPPENRTPSATEAAACREFLDQQLAIIQPKFICCLGSVAAQNLLGTETTIGRLRGKIHDYHGIKVVCTYHPAYVLRNPAAKKPVWDDIQLLMNEMGLKDS